MQDEVEKENKTKQEYHLLTERTDVLDCKEHRIGKAGKKTMFA